MAAQLSVRLHHLLADEKIHLKTILDKNASSKNGSTRVELDNQYESERQIHFYKTILKNLDSNNNNRDSHELPRAALKLLAIEKLRMLSSNVFMTWQFEDENGIFSAEEITDNRWTISQITKNINDNKEDKMPVKVGIARFYRIDPATHTLHLLNTFTHDKGYWKQGLALSDAQLLQVKNNGINVMSELWRLWTLYKL